MQETVFGLTPSPNLSPKGERNMSAGGFPAARCISDTDWQIACGNCGNWFAQFASTERCLVRLPKGPGPSVLPQPCAAHRVAPGIQGRDF
jgi:hypothetical protein